MHTGISLSTATQAYEHRCRERNSAMESLYYVILVHYKHMARLSSWHSIELDRAAGLCDVRQTKPTNERQHVEPLQFQHGVAGWVGCSLPRFITTASRLTN